MRARQTGHQKGGDVMKIKSKIKAGGGINAI